MRGAILYSPSTPSWRGAQFKGKHRNTFAFTFNSTSTSTSTLYLLPYLTLPSDTICRTNQDGMIFLPLVSVLSPLHVIFLCLLLYLIKRPLHATLYVILYTYIMVDTFHSLKYYARNSGSYLYSCFQENDFQYNNIYIVMVVVVGIEAQTVN
jgi:hypothetical protein